MQVFMREEAFKEGLSFHHRPIVKPLEGGYRRVLKRQGNSRTATTSKELKGKHVGSRGGGGGMVTDSV